MFHRTVLFDKRKRRIEVGRQTMKKNISKILLLMMACIIAYLFLLPLLFMVFTSFKGVAESVTSTTLLPKEWTFEN